MKRFISVLLCLVLFAGLFVGCAEKETVSSAVDGPAIDAPVVETVSPQTDQTEEPTGQNEEPNVEEPETATPEDNIEAGETAGPASAFAEVIQNAAEMAREGQDQSDAASEQMDTVQEPAGSTESAPDEVPATEQESIQPTEAQAGFSFTRETMPRLDGSTSTAPLALAVCAALLGEPEEDVGNLVQFNKTTNSYLNLLHGEADLLIVAEANEDVLGEKESLGFEWDKTPFATDAFVFVVNENNPVDSITIQQARDIYTGRITNWKELGGEDREIIPLQRNSSAGSQALMEKLVMQGEEMMEAPTDYIVATMGGLIEAVKSYDNSPGAIGYSVYYYAEEMKMAQGLKLLKVEGVEPNPETIRSGEYTLVNPYYVVIPADAAPDASNRQLYNWLLSEVGQRLAAEKGYVSIMDFEVIPAITPLVGSRWYEDYTPELIPRDDYGLLIPYAGLRLADAFPAGIGCLCGLMTREGVVVTDPVYSDVIVLKDDERSPLFVLKRKVEGEAVLAVAAADGSWLTGFDYIDYVDNKAGVSLVSKDSMTLLRKDGTIERILSLEQMGLTLEEWDSYLEIMSWEGSDIGDPVGYWAGNYVVVGSDLLSDYFSCYDLITGEVEEMSYEDWSNTIASSATSTAQGPESFPIENAYKISDRLLGSSGTYLLYAYDRDDHGTHYYLADGTPLPKFTSYGYHDYYRFSLIGGLIEVVDLTTASYYDVNTLECVFQTFLGYEPG